MTQSEKLQKLIGRAINNGFETEPLFAWIPEDYKALLDYWFTADNYKAVIFNHDFAKALWNKGKYRTVLPEKNDNPYFNPVSTLKYIELSAWQYHLQQAVISEDPISYMYEQVFGYEDSKA